MLFLRSEKLGEHNRYNFILQLFHNHHHSLFTNAQATHTVAASKHSRPITFIVIPLTTRQAHPFRRKQESKRYS